MYCSHCYIGTVSSRRFTWEETVDDADLRDGSMVKLRKQKSTSTSAIIIDYDKFVESYNIDFRRDLSEDANKDSKSVEIKATNTTEEPLKKPLSQDLPFEPSNESVEPF